MKLLFFLTFVFIGSKIFALDQSEDEYCNMETQQPRDEILQTLKSIEKILKSQASHFCKRSPKAENYLKSNSNLADVENKEKAVKNLGIEDSFEKFYTSTIDLTGLNVSRFYPVWWRFPDRIGGNTINIFRRFSENADLNPFGDKVLHVAGLNLQMEGNDGLWGGGAKYLKIKLLSQTYRKTMRNARHGILSIARLKENFPLINNYKDGDHIPSMLYSGLFLRGGLTYHVKTNFQTKIDYSRSDEEVMLQEYNEETWGIRNMAKSYAENDELLGGDYDDIGLTT